MYHYMYIYIYTQSRKKREKLYIIQGQVAVICIYTYIHIYSKGCAPLRVEICLRNYRKYNPLSRCGITISVENKVYIYARRVFAEQATRLSNWLL